VGRCRAGGFERETYELLHGLVDDLAGVGALEKDTRPGILDFFGLARLERTF
jgi:hypothetical protein